VLIKVQHNISEWFDGKVVLQKTVEVAGIAVACQTDRPCVWSMGDGLIVFASPSTRDDFNCFFGSVSWVVIPGSLDDDVEHLFVDSRQINFQMFAGFVDIHQIVFDLTSVQPVAQHLAVAVIRNDLDCSVGGFQVASIVGDLRS